MSDLLPWLSFALAAFAGYLVGRQSMRAELEPRIKWLEDTFDGFKRQEVFLSAQWLNHAKRLERLEDKP